MQFCFSTLLARCVLAGLVLLGAASPARGEVSAAQPLNVVVIEGFDGGRPLWLQFQNAFRDAMVQVRPGPLALYFESIDAVRFPREGYIDDYERWLVEKYRGRRIDAIVAAATVPLDRLLRWRRDIWSNAPMVIVLIGPQAVARLPDDAGIAALTWNSDALGTVALARQLLPATRQVFLIGGDRFGDPVGTYFKNILSAEKAIQQVEPVSTTVSELALEVAVLPSNTVVFYSGVYQDARSIEFTARDVLDALSRTANRPIFGVSRSYLGHGIVGGVLLDPAAYAKASASTLVRMLREPGVAIPASAPADGQALTVDFSQLQRWGISPRRIPANAVVVNRPPGLWEQYYREVMLAAVVLALQSVLLIFLLLEQRRRRTAETGLRHLSGRLLVGQEEERRRIASELHDDVNQKVALLAIGLDGLAASAARDVREAAELRDLANEARGLGRDVHALARRLRPPQIDTAGLGSALEDLAKRTQQRTGIEISVVDRGWPSNAPAEASIVLYRVAQEALQNAVKHSAARSVRIVLGGSPARLELSVSDDGLGIVPGAPDTSNGMGIAGMRERLGLVGGTLNVEGVDREGTTVSAAVPIPVRLPTL
jgi:signal transduction histidine kinase